MKTKFLVIYFAFIFPTLGWCYPEMVRHAYVNCASCHISPSGGGVLTPYGRELSREVLSTWGTQNINESAFAYGMVRPPEWLNLMGLYRSVYAYQNTRSVSEGKYIFMQNDLETSVQAEYLYFVAAVGYKNSVTDVSVLDHTISRRHYVNYRPTDSLSFRAGRFYPSFGINTPDHVIPTKRDLGWDEGQETYNLEAAWLGEVWNLFVTADLGRPDQPSLNRETGFALNPSVAVADTYKVGLSYFYGNGQTTTRNLEGAWGILGFSPHFFLLTEWDFQQQSSKTNLFTTESGLVNYQRLDYEMIQGLHLYLTQAFSDLDFNNSQTLTSSYGLGLQFFPRPHFELNLSWQKVRALAISDSYSDFAWLMFNFYL